MVITKNITPVGGATVSPLTKIHRYEDEYLDSDDMQIPALYMRYVKRFINPNDPDNKMINIHNVLKLIKDLTIVLDMNEEDMRDAIAVNQMRYEATEKILLELKNDSRRIRTIAERMDSLPKALTIIDHMRQRETERLMVNVTDLTERL